MMLYRAQDADGVSRLGYATSADGVTFARESRAGAVAGRRSSKRGGGVEDPRLVRIDGTLLS